MREKYYALEKNDRKASLYVFGSITSYPYREKDKDAYTIVKELSELDVDEISVHINSTGGSVAEALSIYNVLKNNSAKVTTYCDGFACSAASVVFMAGEERVMNEASLLMIHNAWTYGEGNAADFRKQAEDLDKITQASVNAYMRCATISEEEIKEMMDKETWISAKEAKEYGLATKIYEEKTEDVKQSAMYSICKKILGCEKIPERRTREFDVKELAKEIVGEISQKLKKEEKKPEVSAWSAFFGEKEKEN